MTRMYAGAVIVELLLILVSSKEINGISIPAASINCRLVDRRERIRGAALEFSQFSRFQSVGISVKTRREVSNEKANSSWWPPFPFNMILPKAKKAKEEQDTTTAMASSSRDRDAILVGKYLVAKSRVAFRQFQSVASSYSMHVPPAVAPLVVLALLPIARTPATTVPPIHSACKRVAIGSLGLSVFSWAHCELRKVQRLTPLPLTVEFTDDFSMVLPPFLPESVSAPPDFQSNDQDLPSTNMISPFDQITNTTANNTTSWQMQRMRQFTNQFIIKTPQSMSNSWRDWQQRRIAQKHRMDFDRRNKIMEELIAFQALKKNIPTKRPIPSNRQQNLFNETTVPPLGWALVTGASRGIGRAFAVELARWDIPVILVARDSEKLKQLSNELQQCYGIPCCAIQADLTKPGASERLHAATQSMGLYVDILINNAGLSSSGEFVDTDMDTLDNLMDLNIRSLTHLSRLYGQHMSRRKRGRILIVSSVTGAFPGVPGSAIYAATKSFQRAFSTSIAKELERHGVGVTCLTPGAVKGTHFATRGGMDDALCWKYPFYSVTAPQVASRGVRALLKGDTEVIPGLANRIWLRILQPLLPSRVSLLVAETSWKPLHITMPWSNKPVISVPESVSDEPLQTKFQRLCPTFISIYPSNWTDIEQETPSRESPRDSDVVVDLHPLLQSDSQVEAEPLRDSDAIPQSEPQPIVEPQPKATNDQSSSSQPQHYGRIVDDESTRFYRNQGDLEWEEDYFRHRPFP